MKKIIFGSLYDTDTSIKLFERKTKCKEECFYERKGIWTGCDIFYVKKITFFGIFKIYQVFDWIPYLSFQMMCEKTLSAEQYINVFSKIKGPF